MNTNLCRCCSDVWCERVETDFHQSGMECWLFTIEGFVYPALMLEEQMHHIAPTGQAVELVLQETNRGVLVSIVRPF